MDKKVNEIFETVDFGKFKVLEANRIVTEARKKTLVDSIRKNGYLGLPIIVNENMEVVDGQTRLAACKELNVPIYYVIIKGLNIDDCMVLNANSRNWTNSDYVNSYAEQGNENYIRFKKLLETKVGYRILIHANTIFGGNGAGGEQVRNGRLLCSESTFNKIMNFIEWWIEIKSIFENLDTRSDFYTIALAYLYDFDEIDNAKLKEKIKRYPDLLTGAGTVRGCIQVFEKVYNFRNKKEYTYFMPLYDRKTRKYF